MVEPLGAGRNLLQVALVLRAELGEGLLDQNIGVAFHGPQRRPHVVGDAVGIAVELGDGFLEAGGPLLQRLVLLLELEVQLGDFGRAPGPFRHLLLELEPGEGQLDEDLHLGRRISGRIGFIR